MTDFDWAAYRQQLDEDERRELQLIRAAVLLKPIRSLYETEGTIMVYVEGDVILRFDAETQCCDASWFVLSDIDKPVGIEGALITGYRKLEPSDLRGTQYTYGFNIDTTAGTYHVRMANDGGQSGCYSGRLADNVFLKGYTHHEHIYNVPEERTALQPFSCAE